MQKRKSPESTASRGTGVQEHVALNPVFGRPRNFLNNRFAYVVISQRARGLSIGLNLNPDKHCNFACPYCEVNRDVPGRDQKVDLAVMGEELEHLLHLVFHGCLAQVPWFQQLPPELLQLKEVALSGEGEPTLCPDFAAVLGLVLQIRARCKFPFYKVVLITNGTGLNLPEVQRSLEGLSSQDQIWVKLEAGTQEYLNKVNGPGIVLSKVMANILQVALNRPVIIQSLFPLIDRQEPPPEEIEQYVNRLQDLKAAGAQIALVQVYSAHRPPHNPRCGHLRLKTLSQIARHVRDATGLRAEVF